MLPFLLFDLRYSRLTSLYIIPLNLLSFFYFDTMSFSQLLQTAPFYSPAKYQAPRRTGPFEPASLERLLQARRIPGRPLVNPYDTLSADDFDSFVSSVSGKIRDTLTFDQRQEDAKNRRGYLDDDEYWMEMGGKPGQFLGGLLQHQDGIIDSEETLEQPMFQQDVQEHISPQEQLQEV